MSLFLQKMLGQEPVTTTQLPAPMPTNGFQPPKKDSYNPFMAALDRDSEEFNRDYGVNRPLKKPMFLGYKGNKALYGGSRLFILY